MEDKRNKIIALDDRQEKLYCSSPASALAKSNRLGQANWVMSLLWASAHALHALIDHIGRHPHSTFLAARSARGARGKKATGLQISARMTILAFWKAYRGHEGRRSRTEKTPPKARNKASRLTLNLVQLASEGVTLLSLLLRSRLTPKKRVEMPFLWLLDYIVWTNISKVNTLTFS